MAWNLKSKEELKEFLDNLGIEYRYGCFSEKNPELCHLLGEYLHVVKSDFQKAARIYKTNCDDYNHPRSCHAYGNYAILGKGQEKQSVETAYKYYLKACELDSEPSCFNAGIIAMRGDANINREKDYTKGLALVDKACTLNHMNACYYLSGLYISGTSDKVIDKDMKQAFKYSERACRLGNSYACSNVSIMYKKGDGVEKDEKMSEKYRKLADQLSIKLEPEREDDSII
ncbi:hypothetical protein RUM44_001594 [Polyplax serrata]|uniref:Cytochrome c oxidase assembly factor 7 n=1 Tax=Polyplax serrata TaxID=468196 RepID=A0ABR1AL62_POLSC